MKKLLSLSTMICLIVFMQCSKSDDDPTPSGPSGDLTFTSVTPEILYPDDEIKVNGTGFSTTKEDNEIVLGIYYKDEFTPVAGAGGQSVSFTVTSASETELVFKSDDPQYLTLKVEAYYDYAFKITADGESVVVPVGKIRRLVVFNLSVYDVKERVSGCYYYVQAGDSVEMSGVSLSGDCSLKIDNKTVMQVKTIGDKENLLGFRIDRNHFGHLNNDCIEDEVAVTVTNGHGKSLTKMIHIAKSPPMTVDAMAFDQLEYFEGGGDAVLTIVGYSIYSSATVRLSGPNGYESIVNVNAASYPDVAKVSFTRAGLSKGLYNAQIKQGNGDDYGFSLASFKIK